MKKKEGRDRDYPYLKKEPQVTHPRHHLHLKHLQLLLPWKDEYIPYVQIDPIQSKLDPRVPNKIEY